MWFPLDKAETSCKTQYIGGGNGGGGGGGGGKHLPTYNTFILGAVYFSPQLLHASSTAVVCDTESNGIREEVDFHHLAII